MVSDPIYLMAGPRIISWVNNHPRSHRIELDVAHDAEQVSFAVDHRRAIAALPERSAAPVRVIEILNVFPAGRLERLADAVGMGRRR